MCRDRGYVASKHEHVVRWLVEEGDFHNTSYNLIAGNTGLPIMIYDGVEKRNTSLDAYWGLVPIWSKSKEEGLKEGNKFVNAKVETLEESRVYKPFFERGQRCLIPCTHYFEHHWLEGGKKKVPFAVESKNEKIFSMPGLYSTWTDRSTGEIILSYTMLTTAANPLLKKIHNGGEHPFRMPLVIPQELEQQWLSMDSSEKEIKEVLHYKVPAKELRAWPVHTIRGKNALSGPEVLQPAKEFEGILKTA